MSIFNTEKLTPMQLGRFKKQCSKLFRYANAGVMTLGQYLEQMPVDHVLISNGLCKYNRRKFNRMSGNGQQEAYITRLEHMRIYSAMDSDGLGIDIPKIVADCISAPVKDQTHIGTRANMKST